MKPDFEVYEFFKWVMWSVKGLKGYYSNVSNRVFDGHYRVVVLHYPDRPTHYTIRVGPGEFTPYWPELTPCSSVQELREQLGKFPAYAEAFELMEALDLLSSLED